MGPACKHLPMSPFCSRSPVFAPRTPASDSRKPPTPTNLTNPNNPNHDVAIPAPQFAASPDRAALSPIPEYILQLWGSKLWVQVAHTKSLFGTPLGRVAVAMARPKVRFGILGCADIARKLVRAMLLLPVEDVQIVALGSRSLEKAREFASQNHLTTTGTKVYGSYEEVLDDPEVDAVYIPLPAGLHAEWVAKAAEKKKHVLVEKPVASTVEEFDGMMQVVGRNGVQFMDGTMFMHHPRLAEMQGVIRDAQGFGELKEVITVFVTNLAVKAGWTSDVRGQPHLDGLGALGDIGWYCCRFILWAFGFQLPHTVTAHPGAQLSDTGVLTSCGATFEWADGRVATFRCSFLGDMVMKGVCVGSKGTMEVDDFVIPRKEHLCSFIVKEAATWEDRSIGWGAKEEVRHVKTLLPQEALMVQEFAKLVGSIKDGFGVEDPKWATLARNTQVLLNAVKTSVESECKTISL